MIFPVKGMNLHYMSEEMVEEFVTVESIFVRGRNCLALRAKFSPLFTDYYLHLMQYGLRNEEIYDSLLKELMAYFTLYMVARPWAEQRAWTVNLNTPVVANLFVSGSSLTESVVGRVFTQDVKEPEENKLLHRFFLLYLEFCAMQNYVFTFQNPKT